MLITLNLKFAHPQLSSCTWKLIILLCTQTNDLYKKGITLLCLLSSFRHQVTFEHVSNIRKIKGIQVIRIVAMTESEGIRFFDYILNKNDRSCGV